MKTFELELTIRAPAASGATDLSLREDDGFLRLSSGALELTATKTPEISCVYDGSTDAGGTLPFMMICGFLVYKGRLCSNAKSALSFLEDWQKDKLAAINNCDGSFLVVLHDANQGCTELISDPVGTRPLWLAEANGSVYLGTHVRKTARRAGFPLEPDPAWIWSMIHFRRTIAERSSVKNIGGLPAGSIMTFDAAGQKTEGWYDYSFAPHEEMSAEGFGQTFLELVQNQISFWSEEGGAALLLSGGLDSRLLAACAPPAVHCVTLCDSRNREVDLAERVAQTRNLSHEVLIRPDNWYPDLLERSCETGGGVWLWDQAHFMPLEAHGFNYATTLIGYGSDTFFKGNDLDIPELWRKVEDRDEMVRQAMRILETRSPKIKRGVNLLHPDYASHCRASFLEAAQNELEDAVRYCSRLPDLWQLFWNRNLARATALMNLVSLRGFTQERNVFTTVGMRRFYQTLPLSVRRSGQLPVHALRAGGYRNLLSIPDANTWLPYTAPAPAHRASALARKTIASARKKIRARAKQSDFKSNCSWPHNGRFWLSSGYMAELMQGFVDGFVFKAGCFDPDTVVKCWTDHIEGVGDYSGELDFMATFGCVFRNVAMTTKGMTDE
jgi:hypothetical protein